MTVATLLVVGSFAGLAFGFASVLSPDDHDRDLVLFAGERLCHGAVFLLFAVVLKYSALYFVTKEPYGSFLSVLTGNVYQFVAGFSFVSAEVVSFFGLGHLNRVLHRRSQRRPDWNQF